jgi:hypothetical protein
MNKEQRKLITGGLSRPSKMPGYAYNLPAIHCKTGSKLAAIPGTTCHGCYALKGRYRFPNVTRRRALLYVAGRFMAVRIDYCGKRQASRYKRQASSNKQASS